MDFAICLQQRFAHPFGTSQRAMLLLLHPNTRNYVRVRTRFARALALALEFQLGADIIGTAVTPSYQALGQLVAVAVIRTFLNYFLAKEIEELREEEKIEGN